MTLTYILSVYDIVWEYDDISVLVVLSLCTQCEEPAWLQRNEW